MSYFQENLYDRTISTQKQYILDLTQSNSYIYFFSLRQTISNILKRFERNNKFYSHNFEPFMKEKVDPSLSSDTSNTSHTDSFSLFHAYTELQNDHKTLNSNHEVLNSNYKVLNSNYEELQTHSSSLQEQLERSEITIQTLRAEVDRLKQEKETALEEQKSKVTKAEASLSELSTKYKSSLCRIGNTIKHLNFSYYNNDW